MGKLRLPLLGTAALAVSFIAGAAGAAPSAAFDLEPGTRVEKPITYRHLSVFPVVQATAPPRDAAQYLTLAEGMKKSLVTVAEMGSGGQVNRLTVKNASDRPLLLLGGEVVLGGQQDRVLGQDTIVPAKESMVVEVFCVEHGRWSGKRNFDASGGMVDSSVRMKAKFRKAQNEVWDEVKKKNLALKADNSTDTYRGLAAGDAGRAATKPFRDAIVPELEKAAHGKLVGVIAALNGRVTSVDIFTSPELFGSYRDKLLDSIFIAAAGTTAAATPTAPPAPATIQGFMADADAAQAEVTSDNKDAVAETKKGKTSLNSTLKPKSAPPGAKPVYRSYQAVE